VIDGLAPVEADFVEVAAAVFGWCAVGADAIFGFEYVEMPDLLCEVLRHPVELFLVEFFQAFCFLYLVSLRHK